ncbi:MAG: cytidylate kinase-like family protein [Eubacteriales bacterium]|nr:cytidylate kinase-like family protein [Eubacteriales bacterium]
MNKIITISRQFGSGGRTIGREIAERLGLPCYDKELVEKTAGATGFSEDYISEEAEYAPNTRSFAYSFLGRSLDGLSNSDRIWLAERKVILSLAEQGPCVIVGRCADYLLRERADCLNVFIHASKEFRADRIVRLYGETAVNPLKRLEEKDKKRKLNYRYFTDREWGKSENYHLCLDSGYLGIEKTAELILCAAGGSHGNE